MHTYRMGWLQEVGSSKSQVSVAEYSLFYRALVQKRPILSEYSLFYRALLQKRPMI